MICCLSPDKCHKVHQLSTTDALYSSPHPVQPTMLSTRNCHNLTDGKHSRLLLGSISKAQIRYGNESIELGKILLIYRRLHGLAPRYLSDYIQRVADSNRRRLRSSSSSQLVIRRIHSCLLLAIVRFRWLEAASGTVCRPTSPPQLQR